MLPSSINKPLIRVLECSGTDSTSVYDFQGICILDHVGKRITTMLYKPNPEGCPFFTFRGKVVIMRSIKDRLVEGVEEHDADIWGNTI